MKYLEDVKERVVFMPHDKVSPKHFAHHGTSLAAIRHLAEHGRMPTGGASDLFFYCDIASPHEAVSDADPFDRASDYAMVNARRLYIAERLHALGISDLSPEEQYSIYEQTECGIPTTDCSLAERLAKEGVPGGIKQLMDECKKNLWYGVSLGLHPDLTRDFEKVDNGADWAVLVPEGLELKYITSILPLGTSERQFLKGEKDLAAFTSRWNYNWPDYV